MAETGKLAPAESRIGGIVSVGGSTVSVPLTKVANAQRLQVTLSGVNVGGHSGEVAVPIGILVGDVDGNAYVSASDVSQIKATVGPATNANFRADINCSDSINATDIGLAKSRSGTFIP